MLENSDDTITNIAYVSGFSSLNFFNGVFKKEYNCSPKEYRERSLRANYESVKLIDDKINIEDKKKVRTYFDADRNSALKKLYSYLSIDNIANSSIY